MVNVIPVPASVDSIDAPPFILTPSTEVVSVLELTPLATWFAFELDAVGITVDVLDHDTEPGSPAIRLELVVEDTDLANLPATGGRRADDGDPNGERYALDIRADGIRIRALSPEGIFRGLTTLLQIVATTPVLAVGTVKLPAMTVLDAPRFAWRGLSYDVVRTAYTVAEVKRVIDVLALYKANVLHLHLTDSEGWRIEIDSWPLLSEIGGKMAGYGRTGLFYTKAEYADIVRYAADRFITIVPEFDMPGHTAAIYAAYPELAGDGISVETANAEREPWFQVMHPDHPCIFDFVTDVLTEIAAMTPGAYLHIGGDEALGMDDDLYRRFVEKAKPIVTELGKKVIGWQEVARAGFAPGDIAQLWISPKLADMANIDLSELPEGFELPPMTDELITAFRAMLQMSVADLGKALDQGADILVSQSTSAYLDTKYEEPPSDPDQEADWKRLGMPFYPKSTVAGFFAWDPATLRPGLTEDRIVGIEAGIWCETIPNAEDLFFLLLPRLPGLLEKGWSPSVVDHDLAWTDYGPRLAAQADIWTHHGWNYFRSSVVWPSQA
jgi:hexosaminidase